MRVSERSRRKRSERAKNAIKIEWLDLLVIT